MDTQGTERLIDKLRQYRVLEPGQLETLPASGTEPQALARDLVQRGWLTPYQANQLLQGRGERLHLGPYLLLERLGAGGMGKVFKARHQRLGRTVVVKLLHKEGSAVPALVERFRREIQALAQLRHPNIVMALDADESDGTHYLVMEYVPGRDLAWLVQRHGALPVARTIEYVRQAALGLQHAHERGVVHRDIKPSNLLVTHSPQPGGAETVKILDLGLALAPGAAPIGDGTMLTEAGSLMGTPDFLAPEQAVDAHLADSRSDLYSLGCTWFYLLTGEVPFAGGTAMERIFRHRLEAPPPLAGYRPDVPAWVEAVLRRLLAKRPEERYQTPAELAAALQTPPDATAPHPWQPADNPFAFAVPNRTPTPRRPALADTPVAWLRDGLATWVLVLSRSLRGG